MKSKRGITLVELILSLSLVAIIIAVGTNIFLLGFGVQKKSTSEATIQAKARLISTNINNISRYATKTHTIPKSSFQYSESGVRDPMTSYIGVTKAGDVVIDEPNQTGESRKITYLARKEEGVDYEIIFDRVLNDQANPLPKSLSYSIIGKKDGKIVSEIISQVEVLNAVNVEHLGTPNDPAVAIAYSMANSGSQEWIEVSPDAYITLVIDKSGSMDWDMKGDKNGSPKRIDILEEKALQLIDRLANLDFNVYVSLVSFSYHANNPSSFKNLNNPSELEELITSIKNIKADGGTNTGDGLRRAYYQLFNKAKELNNGNNPNAESLSNITQHMMILVDGETNLETTKITKIERKTSWFPPWIWNEVVTSKTYEDGNTGSEKVGDKYYYDIKGNENVEYIANNLIRKYGHINEGKFVQAINTFVIGFSSRSADLVSLNDIGKSVNGKMFEHADGQSKPYIIATNADELDFAFEQFETEVENNLWQITRPQLWP